MRSTLNIIIAVKEEEPVTEDELKMALLVMASVNYFYQKSLRDINEAHKDSKLGWLSFKIKDGVKLIERMITAQKEDPLKWLGVENIPGTKEYEERYRLSKKIYKHVIKNMEDN